MNDGSIRLGYNGVPWTWSTSKDDVFYVQFDRPRRQVMPFKEEIVRTAHEIGEKYHGEELLVMHGGGMDAEAVCWAFKQAGVSYQPLCIADTKGINKEEMVGLPERTQIVYEDFESWLTSNECRTLADVIQEHYCAMLFPYGVILEKFGSRIIIRGSMEPQALKKTCCGWSYTQWEYDYAITKLYMRYGLKGVPSFWLWNTELCYSWWSHSFWNILQDIKKVDTDGIRKDFFAETLGLEPRTKVAWHRRLNLWTRPSPWNRTWSSPVAEWLARAELGVS